MDGCCCCWAILILDSMTEYYFLEMSSILFFPYSSYFDFLYFLRSFAFFFYSYSALLAFTLPASLSSSLSKSVSARFESLSLIRDNID